MHHQCTLWDLVVCCCLEWAASSLNMFCSRAMLDNACVYSQARWQWVLSAIQVSGVVSVLCAWCLFRAIGCVSCYVRDICLELLALFAAVISRLWFQFCWAMPFWRTFYGFSFVEQCPSEGPCNTWVNHAKSSLALSRQTTNFEQIGSDILAIL